VGRRVLIVSAVAVALLAAAPAGAQAKSSILCLNKAGTDYVRKVEPVHCAHFGPGGAFGGGVNLKRIHWKVWGGRAARGRGVECGFHLPCAGIKVRIRAYRRRVACGKRVYTRLKATSSRGTTIVKLARCPRPA
jgi:hypothetical protein